MRKATTCNILLKGKSKLNWYSSDVSVIYQISYDVKDGQGCRPNNEEGWFSYERSLILNLGVGAAAGLGPKESRIPKNDEREVCLIKYSITNKNKIHDLRI